jgi:cytosine deaminase
MSNCLDASRLRLTGASLSGGPVRSVLVTGGRIDAVGQEADRPPGAGSVEHLDLTGYVLLPAPAEPHAHLDKAMLGERVANPSGDLLGAIDATRSAYPTMTGDDVRDRARRALAIAVRRGYTSLRTHVSCEEGLGLDALHALVTLRDEVRATIDLQVFAMAGYPITGSPGARNWDLVREALDAGADGVGGAPWLDSEPASAVAMLVRLAAERNLMVDLHLDETLDRASLSVRTFVLEVKANALRGRATASHLVSLGQQSPDVAREIAAELADAGISVVTLPQTNLYLQGRACDTRDPRGLTAVGILRQAGVVVAGGGDNWRDSFNPTSRIDALETASLLVVAAHLSPADAYDAVSTNARAAMGLDPGVIAVGHETDMVAIRGSSLVDAMANASDDRVVIRRGRVIARTRVVKEIAPVL